MKKVKRTIRQKTRTRAKGGAGSGKSHKSRKSSGIVHKTFKNGLTFEGRYLDESDTHKVRLIGSFRNPIEGISYQGTALVIPDGKDERVVLHGTGKLVWDDGETYEGQLVMGRKHGYGVHTLPTGTVYSGEFKNDIADGWGHLVEANPDGTFEHSTGQVIQRRDNTFLFLEDPMPPLEFNPEAHKGHVHDINCIFDKDGCRVKRDHDIARVSLKAYTTQKQTDDAAFAAIQAASRRH